MVSHGEYDFAALWCHLALKSHFHSGEIIQQKAVASRQAQLVTWRLAENDECESGDDGAKSQSDDAAS